MMAGRDEQHMGKEHTPSELTLQQKARVCRLVQRSCCNYYDGLCAPLCSTIPCVCLQINSNVLPCKWFRCAVLPLDVLLQAEIDEGRKDNRHEKEPM